MKLRNALISVVAACVFAGLSACSQGAEQRGTDDQITAAGNVDAFALHLGDCLISSQLEDTFNEVPGVPCSQAHDSEVVYIFDMPDGAFSDDDIKAAASDTCPDQVASYVGPNYATVTAGGLDWDYFSPSQDSWTQGDREVDCVVYTIDGQNDLTSSLKGLGN